MLNWIIEFLNERAQFVNVNVTLSSKGKLIVSGVPQGSVIGRLLLAIYINNLSDHITSELVLFTDDTKLFKEISTLEYSLMIQSDMCSIKEWSDTWLLKFNLDKCHVYTFGKIQNIKHVHQYIFEERELEHVSIEKNLGVYGESFSFGVASARLVPRIQRMC